MSCCTLDYIPERLKTQDDSLTYDIFALEDILYRRVTQSQVDDPFGNISLTDLSHNIGTILGNEISKSKDVLYSILIEEDFEIYLDYRPLELKIISLNENDCYDKVFVCEKNENNKVRIKLQHAPVCCMYPHCVFQFFIIEADSTETEVTFDNYKVTLGSKPFKYLRNILRQELSLMIIRKEISFEGLQ
jgi:hypothetical protein